MTEIYPNNDPDFEAQETGGQVVPFPARPSQTDGAEHDQDHGLTATAVADRVVEGIIVNRPDTPPAPRFRPRSIRSTGRAALTLIRFLTAHTTVRFGARHAAYVLSGIRIAIRRAWEAKTPATHQKMLRDAAAVGNHEMALEWEKRAADFRAAAHARRMALLSSPVHAARGIAHGLIAAFMVLGVIGIALAAHTHQVGDVTEPFIVTENVLIGLWAFAQAVWSQTLTWGPLAALVAAWGLGRQRTQLPPWLAPAGDTAELDIVIDESTVAQALAALRIPQIRDHLKAGHVFQYLVAPRRDGRGTYMSLRLPSGVPADKISVRRKDLATGLYRAAKEVWPTTGPEEGILNLWVADKGALAEGAGEYPLLTDGFTDVFKGLILGKTLRGDQVVAPVMGCNTITGGMPGQGKSSSARVLMAGAALDPTCELRIWIPDANFDFEAFRPRCSTYVMGAEREKIQQIRDDLAKLHAEVQGRGELLIKYGEPQVTRKLASAGIGLHPVVALLEEAHVAIQDKEFGKDIAFYLVEIVRLGRKRGIHLIVSTQAPTKDSMPRQVTRNCSNGIAFAVGDHVANDALLGDGAYKAGHRATELIPGTDIGTAVVKGITGQRSDIVQFCFLDVARSNDQVTPLIQRVLDELKRTGKPVPGTGPAVAVKAKQRDPLMDIATVLGEAKRMTTQEVLQRLAEADEFYRAWTFADLTEALEPHGAAPYKSDGRMSVSTERVREALANRPDATPEN